MKIYFKRYWQNIPFAIFALRAVWIGCMTCGFAAMLYFLFVIVPTERYYYKEMQVKKQIRIIPGVP